jgi:hypothetical protein
MMKALTLVCLVAVKQGLKRDTPSPAVAGVAGEPLNLALAELGCGAELS